MGVIPAYQHLYQEVKELEHRCHDSTDKPRDHLAEDLHRQIIALQDDMEVGKKPRDLENRMKTIQSLLDRARHTPDSYMSISDADRYFRIFEDLRLSLRKFPNY